MPDHPIAIDHVIFVVTDLDAAADQLLAEHGLASVPGGRHPGHGTGNRIVPLGPDYLELMAVLDREEAATSPMGRWALSQATESLMPAALCLRADDIAPIAAALQVDPLAMSRRTPSGAELSWQLAGLDGMIEHGWPFFIQWHGIDHPGQAIAPHRNEPTGIASATIGTPPAPMCGLIEHVVGLSTGEQQGASHVEIATAHGTIAFARTQ